ncbi:hypothetical protein FRB93_005184 [Tulasnella sp. JGI-2019a]|nr:hypothetical protein FRB93_005184 [Tulasnella sp. JGI-2019a]
MAIGTWAGYTPQYILSQAQYPYQQPHQATYQQPYQQSFQQPYQQILQQTPVPGIQQQQQQYGRPTPTAQQQQMPAKPDTKPDGINATAAVAWYTIPTPAIRTPVAGHAAAEIHGRVRTTKPKPHLRNDSAKDKHDHKIIRFTETPEGWQEYDLANKQYAEKWLNTLPHESRVPPRGPGTLPFRSSECFTCGKAYHGKGACRAPRLNELEIAWRRMQGVYGTLRPNPGQGQVVPLIAMEEGYGGQDRWEQGNGYGLAER